jgi:RNA recognition motif-containing protein
VPAQPSYQYGNYYHATTYTPPSVYSYPSTPMQPVYSQSSAGLPVNLSRGAVITETRGIFLQGLNYSVGNSDLATLLNNAGLRPEQARVHKDSRGASKGVATARFSTKAEAEYAVAKLNGTTHAGKTLTVRMDTNSTVVGSLEPFVVDGTNKSGVSRRVAPCPYATKK